MTTYIIAAYRNATILEHGDFEIEADSPADAMKKGLELLTNGYPDDIEYELGDTIDTGFWNIDLDDIEEKKP